MGMSALVVAPASEPAGHALVAAPLAPERVAAAEERKARQVDVDVDRPFTGGGADDAHQPGVQRLAGLGGPLLGLGLDGLRNAERDAREVAVIDVLWCRRRRR